MFEDASRLAQIIDLSFLRPDATLQGLARACDEAKKYGFAALIVNGCNVARAKAALSGTAVKVGAAVGFPHGACTTTVKIFEAMEAMKNGAEEVDVVANIGFLKSGRFDLAEIDIKNIVMLTRGVVHKIIIETGSLTPDEARKACEAVMRSGAEFVKTSTGYGPRGATVDDVKLIRGVVGSQCRIKASGGIKTLAEVAAMAGAGAERIGASSGAAIMEEYLKTRKS